MIVIAIFLVLVFVMQIFVVVGICRTNNKLNELDSTISTLNDLIVPVIGISSENATRIARILDLMADTTVKLYGKKEHKKKKDKICADNMIIKSEMKGAKFL